MERGLSYMETLPQFVHAKLRENHLPQSYLVEKLGFEYATINRKLNGKIGMNDNFINALAKALMLDRKEYLHFDEILRISKFGNETVMSWNVMDELIFGVKHKSNSCQFCYQFCGADGNPAYSSDLMGILSFELPAM
jgi:hypothetical protein